MHKLYAIYPQYAYTSVANNLRMNDNKKIETIEKAIDSLEIYKKGLKDGNIQSFEQLKSKILNVLTENEKIRFSQIEFYSDQDDFDDIMNDNDLPF